MRNSSFTDIDLVSEADFFRADTNRRLDPKLKSSMGQFLTPGAIANFMSSLFSNLKGTIALLDPGAGVGTLTAAFIEEALKREEHIREISVDAFEIEPLMLNYLESTMENCHKVCRSRGIKFAGRIIKSDFIEHSVKQMAVPGELFSSAYSQYTHCIMNPPYKKIRSDSEHRKLMRQIRVETSNLYTAFLAVAIKLLVPAGELVAIVPRSFCNGVYFKPFRRLLLDEMAIKHLHVFKSRDTAFKDDDVLQENIIIHSSRHSTKDDVVITSSSDSSFNDMLQRSVPYEKVVRSSDPDQFIHLSVTDFDQLVVDCIGLFTHSLNDIGLDVSTGPVVDFRLLQDIHEKPIKGTFPLIYPTHFQNGFIDWPKLGSRKPNAILESKNSKSYLMPKGWYVVTRRFSSKEERRRIVAAVYDPNRIPGEKVGFENHLNVYHSQNKGINPVLAKGLALYLNSTIVDLYFRQFSGHTQVNVADLKTLHYPDRETLIRMGNMVARKYPTQEMIDAILDEEIKMIQKDVGTNPILIQGKINEALSILKSLNLPKAQLNERSALTLLALADVKPSSGWSEAQSPLMGITPIMDFAKEYYGRLYAPNTRETFRRQTMHQFVQAGIAVANPDRPDRPINSPKWVYQIDADILELIRSLETSAWKEKLSLYLEKNRTLAERYARIRKMQMIPLNIKKGHSIELTPGAHSELIKSIIEEFGQRYVPGADILYVGDTGAKMGYFDSKTFQELGLEFDSHGKFPDVVIYFREKNWLLLIEAVTSHGPVSAKRHEELLELFAESKAGLLFVTAFPDRQTMMKYLSDISWETEVWLADAPSHIIHFNGERFLGPYTK